MGYDPNIKLDGLAALNKANTISSYRSGYCLEFVSKMLGAYTISSDNPGYYLTAARAREATPANRRHQGVAPAGAVVYFTNGSRPGHVVVSAGSGLARSTDKPSSGRVGTVSIDSIVDSWGGRPFAFWTDWFMGHDIVNLGAVTAPASVAVPSNASIAAIQTALNRFNYNLAVDGVVGPKTRAAIRSFQTSHSLAVDGVVGPKTWAALTHVNARPDTTADFGRVDVVQRALRNKYPLYAGNLKVDNQDGPKTIAAVKEFQRRAGLSVDGIAGPATRRALGL